MRREDIKKILVIGSGPIIIGQAAEFDYAGTQACKSLMEEGYEVILLNSNPATIMTDNEIATRVYIEPINLDFVKKVIIKEEPDAILGSLGGQTGLNLIYELALDGILDEYNVEILGTSLSAIQLAEDRKKFRDLMYELELPVPDSAICNTVDEALEFAAKIGYPVVVRPAFTLGGTGGGFAHNSEELALITKNGLKMSPVKQCLIEKSIAGYKEIEYETMRDKSGKAIIVCSMENVDPVGIHTGDSIVVAPVKTLTKEEDEMLQAVSLKIVNALGIIGGCNVQLALNPDDSSFYIIEVNPRVSRSSALASKATAYPIARITAKLAVGYTLDEIINPDTKECYANESPSVKYLVCKMPRFPFDKFPLADRRLGTQMKATGEVMAIGANFKEALLKSIRGLELKKDHIYDAEISKLSYDELLEELHDRNDLRIFTIAELLRRDCPIDLIYARTKINAYFLEEIKEIIELEKSLKANRIDTKYLAIAKKNGFSDSIIASLWGLKAIDIYKLRLENNIIPGFKHVDATKPANGIKIPYFYSSYNYENESIPSNNRKIIVLGSGPIRIGQGVEFDYSTVHSVETLRRLGYEAIIINNNPETVSTDDSISDKLYFETLTFEDVMAVINLEKPLGVIVQFGGQTAINLAESLVASGVKILGSSLESIALAEDRKLFEEMLIKLNIREPEGKTAFNSEDAIKIANEIGYPVLVRPSYVLGGRAMEIVYNDEDLAGYMVEAIKEISNNAPILIDKYVVGREVEIDACADLENVLIPGIMEHIERAGVHSGDSMSVYPSFSLSEKVKAEIIRITREIGLGFKFIGLFNIQFIVDKNDQVYVLEVNPRSSRTVPFLSKVTGAQLGDIATKVIAGISLKEQGFTKFYLDEPNRYYVKAPVFSFAKLRSVDTVLGPEMKSTGEVLGSDVTLDKAIYKALVGSGVKLKEFGSIFVSVSDKAKAEALPLVKRFVNIGYKIYATSGTAEFLKENGISVNLVNKISENPDDNVLDLIVKNKISYIINKQTHTQKVRNDGFLIRRVAAENQVPCFTSFDTASAILRALESITFNIKPL